MHELLRDDMSNKGSNKTPMKIYTTVKTDKSISLLIREQIRSNLCILKLGIWQSRVLVLQSPVTVVLWHDFVTNYFGKFSHESHNSSTFWPKCGTKCQKIWHRAQKPWLFYYLSKWVRANLNYLNKWALSNSPLRRLWIIICNGI